MSLTGQNRPLVITPPDLSTAVMHRAGRSVTLEIDLLKAIRKNLQRYEIADLILGAKNIVSPAQSSSH